MASNRTNRMWAAGCIAVVVVLATAMYFVARGARMVAGIVREGIAAPGPPVAKANLNSLLGGVPVAPFLTLDEAASNDPALRLEMGVLLEGVRGRRIIAYRSTEPFSVAAAWYERTLSDARPFHRNTGDARSQRNRERSGFHELEWIRGNGQRLSLVSLPQRQNYLFMLVPEAPPPAR